MAEITQEDVSSGGEHHRRQAEGSECNVLAVKSFERHLRGHRSNNQPTNVPTTYLDWQDARKCGKQSQLAINKCIVAFVQTAITAQMARCRAQRRGKEEAHNSARDHKLSCLQVQGARGQDVIKHTQSVPPQHLCNHGIRCNHRKRCRNTRAGT